MRPGFWFSAFLFGAAVGGALGLLFAPRKGREIREALAENLGTQGVSGEFQRNVSKALSTGRTSPSALVNQAQRELDDLRSQAINSIQDARLRGKIVQKQAELRYLQGRERLQRART
jgi:gas vesicle protein